ncbi:MAG: PAS domain S-box protein [Thermodesulfovibrionales bacterium]|nr:PAS domain S-box protein [Thermodesulfovibrionales bacterium]
MANKFSVYDSPKRLLFIIIFSVFAAEALIMFILSLLHPASLRMWAFLDAALLSFVLVPVLYFFGFRPLIVQITERRRAEETTKASYAELNQVFQTAADGIRLIDKSFTVLRANETFTAMTGIEKATIIGKKCYETFPGPQCHTAMCSLARILNGEERIEVEALKERTDKTKIPCIVTATSFRSHTGELIGIVEDFKDISKRKKAEEELKKSEEKLTAMLQSISDHISMIDRDLNIIWANDAAQHIFGENIVGKKCYEAYQGQTRPCDPSPCYTLRAFQDGGIHHQDIQCVVKDGEIMHFHCSANVALRDKDGSPTAVIMIARDITYSKRLELQFLQAQKMEAVGQLAGGIAHDFNNILTAIIGYGNLLQTDMRKDDPLHYYLSNILSASQKAANLTHALLAFSRKQIISPKPINVKETIRVMENLLLRLIGEDIELTTRLTDKELIVMADENQIEQVLMNLATNARDVMPDGGSIVISTDSVLFDENFIDAHGYGKPGTYALISVTDTGAGMDKSTREKVFEPFFTTKEVGKGTGLGLAVVYGIIKQHEGYVNVYSEPGKALRSRYICP